MHRCTALQCLRKELDRADSACGFLIIYSLLPLWYMETGLKIRRTGSEKILKWFLEVNEECQPFIASVAFDIWDRSAHVRVTSSSFIHHSHISHPSSMHGTAKLAVATCSEMTITITYSKHVYVFLYPIILIFQTICTYSNSYVNLIFCY